MKFKPTKPIFRADYRPSWSMGPNYLKEKFRRIVERQKAERDEEFRKSVTVTPIRRKS